MTKHHVCLIPAGVVTPWRAVPSKLFALSPSRSVSTSGPRQQNSSKSRQPQRQRHQQLQSSPATQKPAKGVFMARYRNSDNSLFYKSTGLLETTPANVRFFAENPTIDHDHGNMLNLGNASREVKELCRELGVQIGYSPRHIIDPDHLVFFDPRGHPHAVKMRSDYARKAREQPLWSFATSFGDHAVVRILPRRMLIGCVFRRLAGLGYPSGRANADVVAEGGEDLRGTLWIRVLDPLLVNRRELDRFGEVVVGELQRQWGEARKKLLAAGGVSHGHMDDGRTVPPSLTQNAAKFDGKGKRFGDQFLMQDREKKIDYWEDVSHRTDATKQGERIGGQVLEEEAENVLESLQDLSRVIESHKKGMRFGNQFFTEEQENMSEQANEQEKRASNRLSIEDKGEEKPEFSANAPRKASSDQQKKQTGNRFLQEEKKKRATSDYFTNAFEKARSTEPPKRPSNRFQTDDGWKKTETTTTTTTTTPRYSANSSHSRTPHRRFEERGGKSQLDSRFWTEESEPTMRPEFLADVFDRARSEGRGKRLGSQFLTEEKAEGGARDGRMKSIGSRELADAFGGRKKKSDGQGLGGDATKEGATKKEGTAASKYSADVWDAIYKGRR